MDTFSIAVKVGALWRQSGIPAFAAEQDAAGVGTPLVSAGDRSVIRMSDRESGLSARTIARRLSSVSGFYSYAIARGDTPVRVNPVPRGLSTRRQGGSRRSRTAPLVRVPRTLAAQQPISEE
jgi:site-specific recombinase XerC